MDKLNGVPVPFRRVGFVAMIALGGLAVLSCSGANTPTQPVVDGGGAAFTADKADNAAAKFAVCHFQQETGTWKLSMLPARAATAHLARHDDAVPGGTTAMSGTSLDAECQPVAAPTCPCFDADYLVDLFAPGEPYRPLTGGVGAFGAFLHDLCGTLGSGTPECDGKYDGDSWIAETWYRYDSATNTSIPNCYVTNWTTGTTLIDVDLADEQFDACKAAVASAEPFLVEGSRP